MTPPRVTLENRPPIRQTFPVSRAISHETIAPFAPLRGAGVERTRLNVFGVSGCVLAVFVGRDHGQHVLIRVIATLNELILLHSVGCDWQHNVSVLANASGALAAVVIAPSKRCVGAPQSSCDRVFRFADASISRLLPPWSPALKTKPPPRPSHGGAFFSLVRAPGMCR
jgi:hypothetical protein